MKLMFIWSVLFEITQAVLKADSPNVKTVLFKCAELEKNCWNHREISLIAIRKAMQDLIPKRFPQDLIQLLKYMKSAQETVESVSFDNEDLNILLQLALADTLGGYLQSVAVPIARDNYYSGRLDYDTMSQLEDMLDDMKERLGTNGASWSRQIDARKFSKQVSALDFHGDSISACRSLFLNDNCPENVPKIPIPYLDDDKNPSAIALPLKFRNLYPLRHPSSTHVLLKYYTLSVNCLKNSTDKDLMTFNRELHIWITEKVYPRLYDDDKWYAGFDGVLRILETMRRRGLTSSVYPVVADKLNLTALEKSLKKSESCNDVHRSYESYLLPLQFLFFILLSCCFCFYVYGKVDRRRKYDADVKDSDMADALLSFYCGLREAKKQNDMRYERVTEVDETEENVILRPSFKETPEEQTNLSLPSLTQQASDEEDQSDKEAQHTEDNVIKKSKAAENLDKQNRAPLIGKPHYPLQGQVCQTSPEPEGTRVGIRGYQLGDTGEEEDESDDEVQHTAANVTVKPKITNTLNGRGRKSFVGRPKYGSHTQPNIESTHTGLLSSDAEASGETETSVEDN